MSRTFACMQRDLHAAGNHRQTGVCGGTGRKASRSPIVDARMAEIRTTTVAANGLPVYSVSLPGTRALTVLVAFDAGARTERAEENGMAHFLEHLVFKGGEKYPTYKDVNETAERLGGMLNAYTSHDLVAFHITVRAEAASEALDLLSDFVARPKLDAEELDRERGVVIQEINRAYDQPSTVAEYLIDRAAFGEHPLGRTVLGPEENLRSFTREGIVAFRERRWAGATGGAFLVGNVEHLPDPERLAQLFARFPALPSPEPYVRAPRFAPETLVEQRDTNQSHLRMIYRPAVDVANVRQRAALSIYSTLLGGSMGSRLFEEIREKRGLCYSVYAIAHAYADVPILQLGSGLDSSKCIEAYARMREIVGELREDGPTEEEVQRARAYAAGRLVLAFENTNAVARYGANQRIVYGEDIDPDAAIAALDAVTYGEVREVAANVAEQLAVACVGPHEASDF
jgi:predicted Zn-dependent peptidase